MVIRDNYFHTAKSLMGPLWWVCASSISLLHEVVTSILAALQEYGVRQDGHNAPNLYIAPEGLAADFCRTM